MATFLYDSAREGFLDGSINWASGTIKFALVTSGYAPNQASDKFLSAIDPSNRVATSPALSSKTVAAGVAGAANVTLSSVTGSTAAAIAIYQDSGSDASSRLIAYIDNYEGLPVTPNGGTITIAWPVDANLIFKL